jgi:serine/threonine-protein kinase
MDELTRVRQALADRYAIEHEIGSGGMATVCLAEDLKHDRQISVRVIDPDSEFEWMVEESQAELTGLGG